MPSLSCFKAHDARGQVTEELNREIACGIGRALVAERQGSRPFAVVRDMRLKSPMLEGALVKGLIGADVIDIGLCGTVNLRGSNTEPLLRLSVETCGDEQVLQCHVSKLEQLIRE